jgi:hypothetical protein
LIGGRIVEIGVIEQVEELGAEFLQGKRRSQFLAFAFSNSRRVNSFTLVRGSTSARTSGYIM